MITTVQCSILCSILWLCHSLVATRHACSQLNNKHRVVVTDFRLHRTCSIIILCLVATRHACSQLNNKHRVVVTDFRLHRTCSIIILCLVATRHACSQLNNKHRVVVTDFRLHRTCSIIILWLHSLSGVIRSLFCNPPHSAQP